MTRQQATQLLTRIEAVKKINIPELLAKAYPNQTDITNLQISKMTVSEFNALAKRVFLQLENELSGQNQYILPLTFASAEFGQSNVDQMVAHFQAQVTELQFPNAENTLLWLAHYQLQNGFFDRSNVKFHTNEVLDLMKNQEDLKLLNANYIQLKGQYDKLLKDVDTQKAQLSDFFNQKQTEFQQLTSALQTANSNNNQIQNLLTAATQSSTKINSALEQSEKNKSGIEKTSQEILKTYSQFKIDYEKLIDSLQRTEKLYTELYNEFDLKLKFVEDKHSYFVDRNKYLDNLIGREVGASLFETFKQRKSELEKPIKLWFIAIILMAILTSIVILGIFTNFFGLFGTFENVLRWENVIVNTLKASPFFFLLYYTIAQYNKERNFQEEYAFKSAAALTIKAYSDILKDDKNKDELVLKAVFGLYKSPINSRVKNTGEVKTIIDMLSELSSKVVQATKK